MRESGDALFERFSGKKDGTIWYYAALVEAFRGFPNRMVGELEREVTELRRLAGTSLSHHSEWEWRRRGDRSRAQTSAPPLSSRLTATARYSPTRSGIRWR